MNKKRKNKKVGNGKDWRRDIQSKKDNCKEKTTEEFEKGVSSKKPNSRKDYNDASWYIPDEKLRNVIGGISFQATLGVPTTLTSSEYGNGGVVKNVYNTDFDPANIMTIEYFSYPGSDISVTGSPVAGGPLSTGMRKLFTAIAAETGRAQNYTPEDLGFAIMAIGDLISAISFAQRLIGVYFTYNPRNRGIPRQLIKAMGINPDTLQGDITRYRDDLNALIVSANQIRMVKDLKYFTKCWELYAHLFWDNTSGMAQYYVTKPAGFLYLDEVPDPATPGEIETTLKWWQLTSNPANPIPWSQLLRRIEDMINRLLTSTTLKDVYNDIINYTKKQGGNLLGFSYVTELYAILPEYDETFLNQVHNMDWGNVDLSSYVISGDPLQSILKASDIFKGFANTSAGAIAQTVLSTGPVLLDMLFTDNPTPSEIIDACVYKKIDSDVNSDDNPVSIRASARCDHPVYQVSLWSATALLDTFDALHGNVIPETGTAVAGYLANFATYLTFRAFPIFYVVDTTNHRRRPIFSDANYFTRLEYYKLKGMFDYYFLGLYDAEVKEVVPF